jgi:hypothetical protein
LVRELAGLLDARLDIADELGLAAVALEVGQAGAAIGSESLSEAAQGARWDIIELGAGEAGSGESDESVRELHLE